LTFPDFPLRSSNLFPSTLADADKKGAPRGFVIPIREVRLSAGARFVFPLVGTMPTIPGLPTRPAYYEIDIDVDTGKVIGLS